MKVPSTSLQTCGSGSSAIPPTGDRGWSPSSWPGPWPTAGHEVHVISYASPFRMESSGTLLFHEVSVPEYPLFKYPPYAMALASKLAEVVVNHRLQILHVHYAIPHAGSAYLAREMVGDRSVRGWSPPCTAPTSRWWARSPPSSPSPAS